MPTKHEINELLYDCCFGIAIPAIRSARSILPRHTIEYHLNFDSLDLTEFVMSVETELGLAVPNETARAWVTVQDIYTTLNAED